MKQTLSLIVLAALFATSCSKNNDSNSVKTDPIVLLSKVTNTTPGDPDNGKLLASFTYNDKQLSKAVIYHYSITPDVETDVFTYDGKGLLTGTSISHTLSNTYDYQRSVVTPNGTNIGKVTFYKANDVIGSEHTLTYQDNKLSRWFNSNEVELLYTYNGNGNNTKQVANEYQNSKPDGEVYTTNYLTFDNKKNLTTALPNWIYFRIYFEEEYLGIIPGINNVLTSDSGNYTYEYNEDGYPSKITTPSSIYTYEYIKVN